ncbi:glycerol-3-phosphate acyltransferase, chloroplastic isoform X2 [Dendrobium catenatum]|uniref:glycerol-3-phosphate acyltransferase, chloroplastic isoform X2 n=1 Tax=Dendrobium catenatum TaxID=906689 RepID=UPI0009F1FFAA|nr:glycerol-3-phosphate acyltransferase, chloroplastic isoform X2 [Dendrobium catenatum]
MTTYTASLDSFKAILLLSATPPLAGSYLGGRISAPYVGAAGPSTSRPYILPLDRRRAGRRCTCVGFLSRGRSMEALKRPVLASDLGAGGEVCRSRPPLRARSEEELLSYVRKEVENGRLSSDIAHGLEELYHSYRNAVVQSGLPDADEIIHSNMTVAFDRILMDIENPFIFGAHHKAIREPFDYYMFGQNYIRPLLDFKKSYIGNISLFSEIEQHLLQGHNIILFSNHQTEADPAVIALLLERTNPQIAESMVFVAGDRVVTDPLCKPFSMGRNLLCVYSKKHLFDDPELVDLKKKANTRSLKELSALFNGSQIIWIAPSGGRDRPDPETGEWFPAPFDASSLDNMRRLAEHSGVPGHFYPLALLCYGVMPPPAQVAKEIGEQRKLSHHGVGLSISKEINFNEVTAHCESKDEVKGAFSMALYNAVTEQYNILKSAIYELQGLNASDSKVSLSQPHIQ